MGVDRLDGKNVGNTKAGGAGALAKPDATWAARIGIANFNKDGLAEVDLKKLPQTADVKKVLALADKDPNDASGILNERPPLNLSAYRDDKSKQLAILVWEPADFMGTLHVFDNAGNKLDKALVISD
jgi:hypothetical protein